MRKPYVRPTITAEDQMEETALQGCYVTEAYDGNGGFGNFVVQCAEENVEKGGVFSVDLDCETFYAGDKSDAPPFS